MADNSRTAYYIGILIVGLSHAYMLVKGLPQSQVQLHAILNLVAAALIAWSWMSNCMP